jgi:hypothetical protein
LEVEEVEKAGLLRLVSKQWGCSGCRELRLRGVSRKLAWNTSKSAHGVWRLSRRLALAIALPGKYCAASGLPQLFAKPTQSAEPPWSVIRMPGGVGGGRPRIDH